MPQKPLIKALTEAGAGPRRRVAETIKQGKVKVNGAPAESFSMPVDPARDKITYDGRPVSFKAEKTVCLALHKPAGLVSTASDEKGRPTVLDLVPAKYRRCRLYPVGRLDIDTTGLILLTNDGDLTYRLTHPRYEYEKEYHAAVTGRLTAEERHELERGVLLEDGRTHPARVREIDAPPYNYSVTIHEGRKRQVRRMFEHLHHPVLALKRVRLGNLLLGDLKEGEIRPLSATEIKSLLASR